MSVLLSVQDEMIELENELEELEATLNPLRARKRSLRIREREKQDELITLASEFVRRYLQPGHDVDLIELEGVRFVVANRGEAPEVILVD